MRFESEVVMIVGGGGVVRGFGSVVVFEEVIFCCENV